MRRFQAAIYAILMLEDDEGMVRCMIFDMIGLLFHL